MKKELWCIFIVMLIACLVLPVSAAENEQVELGKQVASDAAKMTFPTDGSTCEAVCPVHGTSVTWTPLTPGEAIVLTTDTHYYLTDSVSNSKVRFTAPNKWNQYACLHLNGKSVTNTAGAVFVGKNGQLHVMGDGEVKGGATSENVGATVSISCGGSYGAVHLYGGTYSKYDPTSESNTLAVGANGGMLNVYTGATVNSGSNGSAVYMRGEMAYVNATFNLYGGTIDATGSTEVAIDTEAVADDHAKKLTVNMYAGTVKNGSDSYGGNLILRNHVTFNMYGGTLEGGNAATSGGNIAIYGGAVMNMSGGTVTGGTAGTNGGNIYLTNYVTDTEKSLAVLNMSGGTITGGTAVNGGNVLLYNQTAMNMTGGIVEKGTAEEIGGNIASKLSSSATKDQYAEFHFENAIIRGGETTASSNSYGGGNLGLRRANVTIGAGTQIEEGHTASRGGNIQLLRGTILMTGGKLSGGIADRSSGYEEIHLEGGSDTDMSVMYMLGGEIEGRETEDGAIRVNALSRFYLGGNATVADGDPNIHEIRVYSTGKLFICGGWSGYASVHCSDSWEADDIASADKLQVVTLDADRNETVGGSYTGKLTHAGTGAMLLPMGDGTVRVGGIALVDETENITVVSDPLTQWTTGKYAFIRLYSDYTLADPGYGLKLDLNGYGLTLTGSGAVSVFDTSSDAFEVPTGTITVSQTVAIEQDTVAPNGNRYIALEEDGKISMHRLEMRICDITLRPSAAGIYYNAVYYCDSELADAVEAYGVALSVSGMPNADFSQSCYTAETESLQSGATASSVAVFGILKDDQTSETNRQNAQMKIYANPYIRLKDANSTVLLGDRKNAGKTADTEGFDGVAYSLYDLLLRMDETYYELKPAARRIVDTFCQSWQNKGMEEWTFENVGSEILNVDNGPLQFAPGTAEAECPVCEKTVTWTAFHQSEDTTVRIGRPADGAHYYLAEDILYTQDASFILPPAVGETACLHLNGHNLTATAYRAAYVTGSAGTLNIMGEGIVSGNADAVGAVLYMSTSNSDAALNLYGGTYVKPDGNGRALTAIVNGGSLNVYAGAWLKGNGSGHAAYMDVAKNANATIAVYGGKISGGEVRAIETEDVNLRSVIINGRACIEGMLINDPDLAVTISGRPVIDRLRIDDNIKLNLGQLTKGADIAVSVNTAFTQPLQDPESYLPYFRAWNGIDSIGIDDEGALCYMTNYEHYMTPYIRDVRAEAMSDSKIHYYFMAGKGMIINPENGDNAACKWGDSCLVVFPTGETMLIDTGYAVQAPVIAGSLKRMGITTLDYLVITHPHGDHIGGAFGTGSTFLDEIEVEQVYYDDSQYPNNSWVGVIEKTCSDRNIPYATLKMGDVLTFGDVTMTMLWPSADLSTEDLAIDDPENKYSMVFRFDYGEHSSLFTADIYTYTETKLRELYTAGELDVDLMKVPHHGIGQSSLAFIQAVSPELAVATGYHTIASDITSRYASEGVTLLEDIYHGYIHIASGTDGIMSVETE